MPPGSQILGVVIVTFNAADVILDCLGTLSAAAAADGTSLHVVVVDNASSDGSAAAVADWAAGTRPWAAEGLPFPVPTQAGPMPPGFVRVIHAGVNGGFAAGVNIGCAALFADPAVARVWVLNPDSLVPQGTPAAFAGFDPGPFSLMGGRITYVDPPDMIQLDGGVLNRWTGVTGNANQFAPAPATALPGAGSLTFICGASMVVARAFWESAGPMPEDYFLYYEETDWALQRGDLPLAVCPAARIYHRAGSSIGSVRPGRPASPFSLYFLHRARMRFVRRHLPFARPAAWAYTLGKVAQYRLKGWRAEARAVLDGARDAPLPEAVRRRLGPEASIRAEAPFRV